MHIFVTVVAICILTVGVLFGSKQKVKELERETSIKETVLSEEVGVIETETPAPTTKPIPNSYETNLDSYVYPNSKVAKMENFYLVLESNDESSAVTQWYKEKIRSEGMNVKTFVTTKTNGNVLDKLVGANSEKEIMVEVEKKASESKVTLTIQLEKTE